MLCERLAMRTAYQGGRGVGVRAFPHCLQERGDSGRRSPHIASRDEGLGEGTYMALIQNPHPCPLLCEFRGHPFLPLDLRCGRAGGFGQRNEAH